MSSRARGAIGGGLLAGALLLAPAGAALGASGPGRDGLRAHDDDRVRMERAGRCSATSGWRLRLEGRDGVIRVEMEVRRRSGSTARALRWRLVLLHERRIVARAVVVSRSGGTVRLRREVRDLPGPDAIVVRAVSGAGEVCPASARI